MVSQLVYLHTYVWWSESSTWTIIPLLILCAWNILSLLCKEALTETSAIILKLKHVHNRNVQCLIKHLPIMSSKAISNMHLFHFILWGFVLPLWPVRLIGSPNIGLVLLITSKLAIRDLIEIPSEDWASWSWQELDRLGGQSQCGVLFSHTQSHLQIWLLFMT